MNTLFRFLPSGVRRASCAMMIALGLVLGGCDDAPVVTTTDSCDSYLDQGEWDLAIEACGQIETDEGYSKTAQAYMGRAGISLLGLIEKIEGNNAEGLALILSAFTVNPVQFLDVQAAIDLLLQIENLNDTDAFNVIVASDVAISTLIKGELDISVDADTGDMTIPGITDSGLESLGAASAPADIQTALDAIYAANYYSTTPPLWDDSNPSKIDLKRISSFVQANALGAAAVELGELSDLAFSTSIDNGKCALSSGQTASTSFAADSTKVAEFFPRRLNTSDATADYLADELWYVLLQYGTANIDATLEWKGTFRLPSRLLNPDFVGISCGGIAIGLGVFSACMALPAAYRITDMVQVDTTPLSTVNITCNSGGACEVAGTGWPVTAADGNPLGVDEGPAQRTGAKNDLAEVLHQLYPIDNTDTSPGTSGLHCKKNDGWVHAREYDYYLRTLGQ